MDLSVPELGEGIEQATVVRVLVEPGSAVHEGQDVLEVETEKSTMPIPAPVAGVVDRIFVKTGDKVKIGARVLSLVPSGSEAAANTTSRPSSDQHDREPANSEMQQPTTGPAKDVSSQRLTVALPNLGEGIAGGTVVNVLVRSGDRVEAEQPLVEVETEKASIPVPAPASGVVKAVLIRTGESVKIGQPLIEMETQEAVNTLPPVPPAPESRDTGLASKVSKGAEVSAPISVSRVLAGTPQSNSSRDGDHRPPVPASPATRRLARELGVDLYRVIGSAPGGRVTMDDVKAYVRTLTAKAATPSTPTIPSGAPPALPDFSKYGPIERKPFSALRKTIARNLTWSWTLAPQVTQHDLADITELEASRKSFVEAAPKGAPKVTMTVLAIKACVAALKAFPHFNASYDPQAGENGELIIKKYYHIGIAVDTERGLVVPVIRNADQKSIGELAKEVAQLAEKARAGKLVPDEMRGGTFTITNLGGIGGTAFSPIINYPEVAILGLSRSMWQPVVRDGRIEPRLMLPLSLTYDHRVIDGADGARFCARLATLFSDPMRMFFES
jgi:pyruvate dehydrogenase E2 component (dihydrolipoamide acetyltransferase)